jgi:hypothetical protein
MHLEGTAVFLNEVHGGVKLFWQTDELFVQSYVSNKLQHVVIHRFDVG